MRIAQPFLPVKVRTNNLSHNVEVLCRDYTFGANGLLTSIKSEGHELLAGPMRIVAVEDSKESVWDNDYPNNESESFIQSRSDEKAVICGAMQSERFIIDSCCSVDYTGAIDIDLKLMTRGETVAQALGLVKVEPLNYKLDKLWVEIPLRKDICSLFHMFPNSDRMLEDGTIIKKDSYSSSGSILQQSFSMPFKPVLWLGNEERGLGWYAENCKNWQVENKNNAIEVLNNGNEIVLRLRLLDSQPYTWQGDLTKGAYEFHPITFSFGLQATPVKTFPKQPYIHNALHLDCGIKTKGNYIDFLSDKSRFDRLKEKGVTTLILHEKWNKSQNWFELSEFTNYQIKEICHECHKRDIKVLVYFGYEVSTMTSSWEEFSKNCTIKENGKMVGGWWRVPFQRDYISCYNSPYQDLFVDGVEKIMDECHIDGIYLDGTSVPRYCESTEHGCGWYDDFGNLHGSYPLKAIRNLFKRLYEVVSSRGGQINVHSSEIINFTSLPYIHQTFLGEHLQRELMQGNSNDLKLDYFRTEYIGRNMGVPAEFIAYENRPIWTFEKAFSCAVIHGILPRPNDIEYPLEFMSKIWEIFDRFPIEESEWKPYWSNDVDVNSEKIKVSYYKYTTLDKKTLMLAFAVNTSPVAIKNVTLKFNEEVSGAIDLLTGEEACELTIEEYGFKILYLS